MAIRIQRPERQRTPTSLDGTVEVALLQQRVTESVTSEKIIGTYRYCLLIMSDGFIHLVLPEEDVAQTDLSVGQPGIKRQCRTQFASGLLALSDIIQRAPGTESSQ